jgi:acyl-phosphate glycerol 3-phosphate acyltransferase
METVLFAIAGYLIGSIPVAYLLARKRHGIDLRREGSGNIGARNAFDVTGNKRLGFAVLVLDMHKGIIPLVILDSFGYSSMIPIVAVTIVLGHCYPLWLKFHGGRGLATGGTIMLLIAPKILLCWVILYYISSLIKKQVHVQAFIAITGCIVFEFIAQQYSLFSDFRIIDVADKLAVHYSVLAILMISLSRHIQPVRELFQTK